ncbi:MAG: bifunctional folylpolyglutamate synthase/dihydrofolate synthase [Candidatus Cloacimonetes bacterium]|nr:bifunctional folylpolyglutamate synthase/dihydrofolate synthase [Candidatus Cloacimonadota bacterium]
MDKQTFLDTIYQRHSGNVKLGLERMEAILAVMEHPERRLRGVHVGGTNGKGSTCAIIEALALAHGQTTGLNTSPHLVDYRERIRLDGQPIAWGELYDIYTRWAPTFIEHEASFFEITTSMAFAAFVQRKVDTAIFEVGLGGRLDGTRPFVATINVITSISIDHPKSLGDTIEKIAFEKAGILKPQTPLVLGQMPEVARKVILHQADKLNAPTQVIGRDFHIDNVRTSLEGASFDYRASDGELTGLRTNMIGAHQAQNAALALRAFQLYMQRIGETVDEAKVRAALLRVHWPGRLEVLHKRPLVLIDGAHNEEGVQSLVQALQTLNDGRKCHMVLAILRDKKLDRMIGDLCTVADKLYISKNKSNRAAEIAEQVEAAQAAGTPYETAYDVTCATRRALEEAAPDDLIVITGSLYTISEILPFDEKILSLED